MEAQTLTTGSYSEALALTDSLRDSVSVRRPSQAAPTTEAQNKPVLLVDTHFRIRSANRPFCEQFGISPTISNGALLFSLGTGQWDQHGVRAMLTDVLENGGKRESTVTMDLAGQGHCLVRLTAERRMNYRPLDLIAITIEECLLTVPAVASDPTANVLDEDAIRLSRSVMAVSRGLYRELVLIMGCAQEILESGNQDVRESAAEIIAAAHQIQDTHSLLLLQARTLSNQVPAELMQEVMGSGPLFPSSAPVAQCPPADALVPLNAPTASEPMGAVLLKAA